MSRHFVFNALVLHRYPIGEIHRGVVFLTKEQGLITAIAFGAAKSKTKKKLLTSPFCRVLLKASYDPVKDSWQVVDLEEREFYQEISANWERYFIACLWAKLLIKIQGTGHQEIFDLFAQGYSLLGKCSLRQVGVLRVQLLWRFLELSGIKPNFVFCYACGKPLQESIFYFDPHNGVAFCQFCQQGHLLAFPMRAAEVLLMTEMLSLEESLQAPLEDSEVSLIAEATKKMLEDLLGQSLKEF